jgi:hypothetical protein
MNEKNYHIEGDTLIVNDGVTDVMGKDFHVYDENHNHRCSIEQEFKSIKKVKIPDSVTSIGEGAFYQFENLESIIIPKGVTSIEYAAFACCKNLKNITIPDSVTNVDDLAFADCVSLTSVTIPDSVTNIGAYAFYDCKNLKSITIPDSVTNIGEDALRDCENFTIKCNKGSYAEKYAKLCNIPIKHIKDKTIERE